MSKPDETPPLLSAAVLAIGDEVLRGEIVNGNAAYLSARLFDLGFVLREHQVVSDDPQDIRGALRRLGSFADVVVVTGGLGPTDDDRTVDVVCDLLGTEPVIHEPSRAAMEARFAKHGFVTTPNNLRQVRVPAGATVLPNSVGLAPGFAVTLGRAEAFFMPGVPREMNRIFEEHVVAHLRARLEAAGTPPSATRSWHVYGMGESHVDHRLAGLLDGVTDATLHFRTAMPENHVKVVVRGRSAEAARELLDRLDADVRGRLGSACYGSDDDSFAMAVQRTFVARGATLALAESCTGGYAGQIITSEPGSSAFFVGGVVSYSNDIKTGVLGVPPAVIAEHGAVSEACARAMAEGVRRLCRATVGVAITGIAGSDREAPGLSVPAPAPPASEGKPVGTVWFAVATESGTVAHTRLFAGGRERIRRSAAFMALDLARRALPEPSDSSTPNR